jgi:predicted kinase
MLIVFSGLSGTGKTSIARELARQIGAVHLRIDSIEQAIRDSGVARTIDDAGYRVAYALAEENLNLGLAVVADSVNPWPVTRDAWRAVAERARVAMVEIEVTCSDMQEHRTRVEKRLSDIPRLNLPTWQDVIDRDYRPWNRERLVLDTARCGVADNVATVRAAMIRAQAFAQPGS